MRLAEDYKIVPVGNPIDLNSAATVDFDSINMKNFHRATFVMSFGTLAGESAVLTVYSGATDGACTSQLYFKYAFGSAAASSANCDVLAAETLANTLTITHTTYDNYMLIVEVEADRMDRENAEEWLTLRFTDPGGATGLVNGFAILEPRYTKNLSVSALA